MRLYLLFGNMMSVQQSAKFFFSPTGDYSVEEFIKLRTVVMVLQVTHLDELSVLVYAFVPS